MLDPFWSAISSFAFRVEATRQYTGDAEFCSSISSVNCAGSDGQAWDVVITSNGTRDFLSSPADVWCLPRFSAASVYPVFHSLILTRSLGIRVVCKPCAKNIRRSILPSSHLVFHSSAPPSQLISTGHCYTCTSSEVSV